MPKVKPRNKDTAANLGFEAKHAKLDAQKAEGAAEDPDEERAASVFWVPKEARWAHLKASTIGKLVDDAIVTIERDNPSLKGVLPKDYARLRLDKQRLGQLINLVSDIGLGRPSEEPGWRPWLYALASGGLRLEDAERFAAAATA